MHKPLPHSANAEKGKRRGPCTFRSGGRFGSHIPHRPSWSADKRDRSKSQHPSFRVPAPQTGGGWFLVAAENYVTDALSKRSMSCDADAEADDDDAELRGK